MKTIRQLEAENEDLRRHVAEVLEDADWHRGQLHEAELFIEDLTTRLNAVIETSSIAEAGRLRYEAALKEIAADDSVHYGPLGDHCQCAAVEANHVLQGLSIPGTVQGA